jgi:hypothetical protein
MPDIYNQLCLKKQANNVGLDIIWVYVREFILIRENNFNFIVLLYVLAISKNSIFCAYNPVKWKSKRWMRIFL